MARAVWDADGERKFMMGVSHGMLYKKASDKYGTGVPWNGLTGVTESPSGAEPTDLWADNIKYARLISAEDYGFTVEAYYYPDAWKECDGSVQVAKGVTIGQQKRIPFGFSWQTKMGNDQDPDAGYTIHIVWNATAQPSERSHETVNESPDAMTFSWECGTVPTNVTGYEPTAVMEIDSTAVEAKVMKALEDKLYGTADAEPTLPSPDEIIALITGVQPTSTAVLGKAVIGAATLG